jgi:UPF0716 protein FxsA
MSANRDKSMLRFLPFLMLIVPLTEIAVFIVVGQWIGVVPTIALVILTAVLGASLLRHQGLGLAMKLRSEMEAGRVPGRDLAHGAMMLVAGVLLLTPGFVTDTLGFLLFIPQIRTRVFEFLAKRVKVVTPNQNSTRTYGSDTIDLDTGDYEREDDAGAKNPDSPWNNTKH